MANTKKMDQVILGLLSHEDLTGYDIKKRIDSSLGFFWSGSFGSIYPTLSLLEKEGKVTKTETTDSSREKIFYSITPSGRDSLKQWLGNPVEKDEIRFETMLKLFMGKEAGFDVTEYHVNRFEEDSKNKLQILRVFEKRLSKCLDEDDNHKYYFLTVSFGIRTYEAYIEWCEEAKKKIRKWKKNKGNL